jgi:hypothetical protein
MRAKAKATTVRVVVFFGMNGEVVSESLLPGAKQRLFVSTDPFSASD